MFTGPHPASGNWLRLRCPQRSGLSNLSSEVEQNTFFKWVNWAPTHWTTTQSFLLHVFFITSYYKWCLYSKSLTVTDLCATILSQPTPPSGLHLVDSTLRTQPPTPPNEPIHRPHPAWSTHRTQPWPPGLS